MTVGDDGQVDSAPSFFIVFRLPIQLHDSKRWQAASLLDRFWREAKPMTHIEALDLQRRPEHLIVLRGGYVGLERGQALRRLGSRVTLIDRGSQLAPNEDADVAQAILQLFRDEDIDVLLDTR